MTSAVRAGSLAASARIVSVSIRNTSCEIAAAAGAGRRRVLRLAALGGSRSPEQGADLGGALGRRDILRGSGARERPGAAADPAQHREQPAEKRKQAGDRQDRVLLDGAQPCSFHQGTGASAPAAPLPVVVGAISPSCSNGRSTTVTSRFWPTPMAEVTSVFADLIRSGGIGLPVGLLTRTATLIARSFHDGSCRNASVRSMS